MSAVRPLILVVDDEENIRFLVTSALGLAGMETVVATSGQEALAQHALRRPDAIVLDIMLPDLDGFAVLRRLRADGDDTPIIFLTAREAISDRVRGLSDGGDDYLVKPFDVAELVARVRLRLRGSGQEGSRNRLRVADLELDTELHTVVRNSGRIFLSPTEFKLLNLLMVNSGRVLSRSQILDHVWSYDAEVDPSVVDTYISYLRKKVDIIEPRLIHTIRGVGFTLRVES
ncbi:MAG: response regulator transcription factor [Thermomicrobiales bacterium]|nr:response regulator transcription factor [Thermomicrobiales bacterium]